MNNNNEGNSRRIKVSIILTIIGVIFSMLEDCLDLPLNKISSCLAFTWKGPGVIISILFFILLFYVLSSLIHWIFNKTKDKINSNKQAAIFGLTFVIINYLKIPLLYSFTSNLSAPFVRLVSEVLGGICGNPNFMILALPCFLIMIIIYFTVGFFVAKLIQKYL